MNIAGINSLRSIFTVISICFSVKSADIVSLPSMIGFLNTSQWTFILGVFEFKKRFQREVSLFLWWIWGAYFLAVYFPGFIVR